jgi:hypothetical protein
MAAPGTGRTLIGCDFSSSPGKHKQIVIARGQLEGDSVRLDGLERLHSLLDFALWLARPCDWVGGFDLPFGLPRELVQYLDWPTGWEACMRHYAALTRPQIRAFSQIFATSGQLVENSRTVPRTSQPVRVRP